MIAVDDERADAGVREPLEAVAESELGPGPPVGTVVDIACEQTSGHPLVERGLHQPVERIERGVAEHPGHLVRVGPELCDRSVQVQVGGVQESHSGISSLFYWWNRLYGWNGMGGTKCGDLSTECRNGV